MQKKSKEEILKKEKELIENTSIAKNLSTKKLEKERPINNKKVHKKTESTSIKTTSSKKLVHSKSNILENIKDLTNENKTVNTKENYSANVKISKTNNKNNKNSKKVPAKKMSQDKDSKISKNLSKHSSVSSSKKAIYNLEYYDLPNAYNYTVVKILAQTPFCLFVYWEISEKDVKNIKENYGENIFENTIPYLVVKNETKNYSFEVEINDYANSWYIHINDTDSKYKVELIRKFKNTFSFNSININNQNFSISTPIYITSSNQMDVPNDHIIFDKLGKTVFFKNVKTNVIESKNIASLYFLSNIGKIYNIYDFYKTIYKNELNESELGLDVSSSNFSSSFK